MRTKKSKGHGSPRLSRAERNAYKRDISATFGKEAAKHVDIVIPEVVDERDDERKALSAEAARLREQRKV